MALLYKYIRADAPDGTPLPLRVLRTRALSATDPRTFNDPFEVRPWFDQERHDHFARGHEAFYERTMGYKHSLLGGRSMVGLPTESAVGFAEELNQRFREDLSRRFRALCLSANPKSVLMWSHYTRSYRGIVLGIETSVDGFPSGLKSEGFTMDYSPDRSRNRLPLAYYQFPPVEWMHMNGRIGNRDDEEVVSDGGLIISFGEYRRLVEQRYLNALTTKAQDWQYEQEVRFIYDLTEHREQLQFENDVTLVSLPEAAIREVIVGFRAELDLVREIASLSREGRIGQARLFYTICHPHLFEVQAHETDAKYLLQYFETILPSQEQLT